MANKETNEEYDLDLLGIDEKFHPMLRKSQKEMLREFLDSLDEKEGEQKKTDEK